MAGEGGGAHRLTKEAGSSRDLVVVRVVGVEEGECFVEAVSVAGGQGGGRRGATGRGEDVSFASVEAYAQWSPKFFQSPQEPGEIRMWQADRGVVHDGRGVRKAALAVVQKLSVVFPLCCSLVFFFVELVRECSEDEAREEGAQGAALWEAFLLRESCRGVVVVKVPRWSWCLGEEVV